MFGMGGSEILVILIVALLFLGPDKLPDAAKKISKGIRDIKKQSRALQQQIENDEQIGGAIRDLKSALRGEEAPIRKRPTPPKATPLTENAPPAELPPGDAHPAIPDPATGEPALAGAALAQEPVAADLAEAKPAVRLPALAGEPDADTPAASDDDDDDLAKMIKPAAGTVAKGSEPSHG